MKIKNLNGRDVYWTPKFVVWDGPSRSKFQSACKLILSVIWHGNTVAEEQNIPGTRLSIDFINFSRKIIIECDGLQHRKFIKYFHGNNPLNFAASIRRDDKKEKFAEINGYTLLRVRSPEELKRILFELNK